MSVRKQLIADEITKGQGDRVRRFVISTASVDRDNDTIDVNGWRLDAYRKNPVVLWAHRYDELPLAKCTSIGVEGNRLVASAEFARHEKAETVLSLIDGGFLRATSVGFRPLKAARNHERGGMDFVEQELLEFSIVPVPANADALRRGLRLFDATPSRWIGFTLDVPEDEPALDVVDWHPARRAVVDPLADPRARGHHRQVFDVDLGELRRTMAATVRDGVSAAIAEAVASSLGRLRGRID